MLLRLQNPHSTFNVYPLNGAKYISMYIYFESGIFGSSQFSPPVESPHDLKTEIFIPSMKSDSTTFSTFFLSLFCFFTLKKKVELNDVAVFGLWVDRLDIHKNHTFPFSWSTAPSFCL